MSRAFRTLIPAIAPIFLLAAAGLAQPLDPTFTYQGDLVTAGLPATGLHDMRFRLYTAATGGTQLGSTLCLDNVSVIDGKFAALLNFGAQFAGQKRFLEIEVRADSGADCTVSTGFSILSPRQELTAAPNASYTLNAGLLEGSDGAFYRNASNILTGTLADARLSTNIPKLNAANVFTGALTASGFTGSGASLTGLNATNIAAGTLADARLSTNVAKLNAVSNVFTGALTATGFTGSGATLTGLDATNVTAGTLADARLSANIVKLNSATNLFTGAMTATSFTGSGTGLTGLNATNITTGTLADARLSGNIARFNAPATFSTMVSADVFSGSGVLLTNLNAGSIATGFLSDLRLSSNIPRLNAPAAFANSVSASFFAGSGALLTGLNASNISAGSLSDARLSVNVAMRGESNAFSGPVNSFSGPVGFGTESPTRPITIAHSGYGLTQTMPDGTSDVTMYVQADSGWIGTVNPVPLAFFTGDSLARMLLSTQGWLGVGTTTPSAMLDVVDEVRVQGGAIRKGGSQIEASDLGLYSEGAGDWMRFVTSGGAFRFYSNFANGSAAAPTSSALLSILPSGSTGIGLNAPLARLHVDIANAPGTGQAAGLFSVETCGLPCGQTTFIEALRAANLNGNGRVGIGFLNGAVNTNGVANAWIGTADGAGTGHIVFATRTNGVLTEQARIRSDGITEVKAIQINGGADIVEGFDSSQGVLEPGTVVVIDPEHPGSLKQSDGEYDTKVAGIVSGAGGINHGLHLGQKGILDGETRVAMTGRVYVKCSAAAGAIKPGDLLTTASIAGHAMKAADATRSQGSVIGKAMTALDGGEGLVLVLVNLQ